MTLKAIYDIRPGYLKECLSPIVSAHLVCSGRVGVFQVSSPNVAMFYDLGSVPSLSWLSSSESMILPEIRMVHTFLEFQKALKTWIWFQVIVLRVCRKCHTVA